MKEQRICRKCLLRDMEEGTAFQNMYTYIANLDEDDKVSDMEYERRLLICRQCEHLLSGMCRKCGCFVEMRAAMKIRHCPDIPNRW
ncbi:MAG: DUF6171 family protein [Blautia sp.]